MSTVRIEGGTTARTYTYPCQHCWTDIFSYPLAGQDYGDRVVARYCLDCGAWESR